MNRNEIVKTIQDVFIADHLLDREHIWHGKQIWAGRNALLPTKGFGELGMTLKQSSAVRIPIFIFGGRNSVGL